MPQHGIGACLGYGQYYGQYLAFACRIGGLKRSFKGSFRGVLQRGVLRSLLDRYKYKADFELL